MNICFALSSLASGGAERVASTLCNYFYDQGHKVTIVLVSVSSNNSFYDIHDGIKIVPLMTSKKDKNPFRRTTLLRNKLLEISPDIVIAFLPHICIYTYFALRKTKIPFICSERNDPHQYSFLRKLLLKKAFKKANGAVFQTNDARKFYKKVPDNKACTIKNPVFLDPELNIKNIIERKKLFISVGRLTKQKNFDLLIRAFSEFHKANSDYSLTIYGEGPLRDQLTQLIEKLNLTDSVFLPGTDKHWHQTAVLSKGFISSSNYEGMPNCLEEALCLGCPSVATDCPVGGSRELIELFGFGKLISAGSEGELIQSLYELKDNKIPFGTPDYSKVSVEHIGDAWIDFIKKIVQ